MLVRVYCPCFNVAADSNFLKFISLNADCYQDGEFVYRKQAFDPNTVDVTALCLIPQIRCLCVGYSFGSFQLYSLCPMVVICSSPISQDVAVTHFAYMEPENDPRSFVYLWVATGVSPLIEERYACSCMCGSPG